MKNKRVSDSFSKHPEFLHKKKQIRSFHSFSEMDETDAKEMAALTPKEHLRNTTFLIKQIFADDLRKPMNKKVKFR